MNIFNTNWFDRLICFIEKWYFIFIAVIITAAVFNLFYNLGNFPINSWDEARHGVNAYEMIKRNNFIVSTYAYKTDYWNLKPPVSYWAIILGYRLAGYNPLGLRIFSAIASLATILIVAIYTFYNYGRLASLIAVSVITVSTPFILEHCARTGDADSFFVLFFTASITAISLLHKNIKWLYVSGFAFALAFLTKSWHAGCIAIIIGAYVILNKRYLSIDLKEVALFILSAAVPIMFWGILRYSQDGFAFFKMMTDYDLIARTSKTLEGHTGSIYYYIEHLQFSYFYWLLVLVSTSLGVMLILVPDKLTRQRGRSVSAILLWIAVPLLLYTAASTKVSWYILPVYPAMAICIGVASSELVRSNNRNLALQLFLGLMIVFSIYKNESDIINNISKPKPDPSQVLIEEVGKLTQYRGKRIYIHHFEQSYWLISELYGDMMPMDGGVEGFLKDNGDNPLLFITKDKIALLGKEIKNLRIVKENENAYIFTK